MDTIKRDSNYYKTLGVLTSNGFSNKDGEKVTGDLIRTYGKESSKWASDIYPSDRDDLHNKQ